MSLLAYTYHQTDGSLDDVASRFGTTADAIREATRNPGPVANWPHDIDDPAWGTRAFDEGATILIPVPDSPEDQNACEADASTAGPLCVAAAPMSRSTVLLSTLTPVDQLSDAQLGPEHAAAVDAGNTSRQTAILNELLKRLSQTVGTALPRGAWPGSPANVNVTAEVALKILDNYKGGEMPWRPELGGVGRAAWFVTEGNPYVGPKDGKTISLDVEIRADVPRIQVSVAATRADEPLYQQKLKEVQPELEAQMRAKYGIKEGAPLLKSMRIAKEYGKRLEGFAEIEMWKAIGERAAASPGSVIEVTIPQGEFSRQGAGKFAIVADRNAIRIKGGPVGVVDALKAEGIQAEPVVTEAAEALATRLKWAGRVRGAFRYGGRVLIVVALVGDAVKIYRAKDRVKAVIESAGGWAGATAAGSAFAAWWTPADVAGPWAWVGHGVGTLIAGGVGYWVGSSVSRTIYELVVEPDPSDPSPPPDAPAQPEPTDGGVGTGPDEADE